MSPKRSSNDSADPWPRALMDTVIESDIVGLSILQPEFGANNAVENFRWVAANNLVKAISGGKDLAGRLYTEVFPSSVSDGVLDLLKKVFNTGRREESEIYYDDGVAKGWQRQVYVRAQSYLVVSSEGITEPRQAEKNQNRTLRLEELNARLNDIDRAKTKFFNNISHEFRTPLSLILAPIKDLISTGAGNLNEKDKEKLQIAERNVIRLQKLVNSLLDFSRVEAGAIDAIYQPTDLTAFTREMVTGFRNVIEQAGLKFVFKADDVKRVYVNREMWAKIVLNLLSNAFKFTLKGKIEVRLEEKKRKIQFEVRDTGSGIKTKNISKIFDRFVTFETPGRRTQEGSGIGLSLVKELVALNGGVIKVKSKEGEGSVFIVQLKKGKDHLPASQVFETHAPLNQLSATPSFVNEAIGWTPAEPRKASKKLRQSILVVDDNADMRRYITRVLDDTYNVIQAENGRIALNLLVKGTRPDLILSDIMMPEVDGYDLVSAVKKNPQFKNIPVILLSAKSGEDAIIEGMEAGADDYLEKPFSSRELLTFIKARL